MTDEFDPGDPAFVRDPYPAYARLRAEQRLTFHEPTELWLVPGHRDVDALLRDRRLGRVFVPREPRERFAPWNLVNEHALLEMEPPEHTRLRRLVAGDFTPRRVEALRPHVRALVDGMLAPLREAGEGDLVTALAEPLPVAVIAELLGVPEADRHLLRPWSNAIVALYELTDDAGAAERAVNAAREFGAYLRELAAERRRRPGTDLLSALVARQQEGSGDALSEDELVATAVLLNAGHEASVNALGNGVVALLHDADELARLRTDPDLVPTAVEELLRIDTPLSLFQRTVLEPVEVAGQPLAAGNRVGLLLASANRDPDAFDRPDELDVGRDPNPHVGFGAGIHFCLGAPLARVELQEALAGLLRAADHLEPAAPPTRRESFQFRGHAHVPLTLA